MTNEQTLTRNEERTRAEQAMREALAAYKLALESCATVDDRQDTTRELAEKDLFFFVRFVLHREDVEQPWVFMRCREWQRQNDGIADLWAREHYKSTIGTMGGILWGIIHDPERTYAILSYVRAISKSFLRQIKTECETNPALHDLWPHIFWADPEREAKKWSLDDGLLFKRKSNPKEASIEAWGLVEGQPTSKHFSDLDFEDAVTEDAVATPESIHKTTNAIRLSFNLGQEHGRRRVRDTVWHYNDPMLQLVKEGVFRARIHKATYDGNKDGEPVLWTRAHLAKRINDLGPYNAGCQLFLDPVQSNLQGFRVEWLRYWKADRFTGLNLYIVVDPASSKKVGSDYTVFIVVGLGADKMYYILRMIRDRLSLVERANVLFKLHQEYQPIAVGYEQYGMQSDVQHMEARMEMDNYRFTILPLGGRLAKAERIGRLVAPYNGGRIWMPEAQPYVQYDGERMDLTQDFINEEFRTFPFGTHDDMLDCLARILDDDLGAAFPEGEQKDPFKLGDLQPKRKRDRLRFSLYGRENA